MKEYFLFKKFIMPFTLQILFWSGIGGTLYGSWWLYTHDNWVWILALIFGSLITRLVFEGFIIRYQTYVLLQDIRDQLCNDR